MSNAQLNGTNQHLRIRPFNNNGQQPDLLGDLSVEQIERSDMKKDERTSIDSMIQNNLVCPSTEKKLVKKHKVNASSMDMLANVSELDISVASNARSRDKLSMMQDRTGRDMSKHEVIHEESQESNRSIDS